MRKHLASFATSNYFQTQDEQVAAALRLGIDQAWPWRPRQLQGTEFFRQNQAMFSHPRGFGYWLWKPYLLRECLRQLADGDFLLYLDAGASLVAPVDPLVHLAQQSPGIAGFSLRGRLTRYWTKRDCFVLMNADEERYYDLDQINSAFVAMIKNRYTVDFVDRWLELNRDPRLATDAPSTCGLPELPEFIEHRHDQSIFTLLCSQHGVPIYRDPSQYGNHLKLPQFRVAGEYLERPYAPEPDASSPYGTLIDHHRRREAPPGGLKRLARTIKRRLITLPRQARARRMLSPNGPSQLTPQDLIVSLSEGEASSLSILEAGIPPAWSMVGQPRMTVHRVWPEPLDPALWQSASQPPYAVIRVGPRHWTDDLLRIWQTVESLGLLRREAFIVLFEDLRYNHKAIDNIIRRLGEPPVEEHLLKLWVDQQWTETAVLIRRESATLLAATAG